MTRIIADTTSSIPLSLAKQLSIPIIPQIVTFGTESYYEGTEMDNEMFISKLTSSDSLPKTAAPPPELFKIQFASSEATGESIVCIMPSADISGTVRSASVARSDYEHLDIHIVDSRVIGAPLGIMVMISKNMAEGGATAQEIVSHVESMIPRWRIFFMVDTLEYLARGGRIGGAAALFGGVLQIKPILTLEDGKVDTYDRERTTKRALRRMRQIVYDNTSPNNDHKVCMMHAGARETAQSLAHDISEHLEGQQVPVYDVPPAIVTHAGPGLVGVGFLEAK